MLRILNSLTQHLVLQALKAKCFLHQLNRSYSKYGLIVVTQRWILITRPQEDPPPCSHFFYFFSPISGEKSGCWSSSAPQLKIRGGMGKIRVQYGFNTGWVNPGFPHKPEVSKKKYGLIRGKYGVYTVSIRVANVKISNPNFSDQVFIKVI